MATLIQKKPDALPSLTEGKITPQVFRKFERAMTKYFLLKNVPAADRALTAACCIEDRVHAVWIEGNLDDIRTWTFDEFISNFKYKALEKGWAAKLKADIGGMYQKELSFDVFQNSVRAQNSILAGTPKFMQEEELRNHLSSHLHADLRTRVDALQLDLIDDFEAWVVQVNQVDCELIAERNRFARMLAATSSLNIRNGSHSRVAAVNNSNAARSGGRTRCPKLLPSERELLLENGGCLCCRKFFAGHKSCDNWPEAQGYKTITWDMAQAAKKASRMGKSTTRVAAVPIAAEEIAAHTDDNAVKDDNIYYDIQNGVVAAVGVAASCVIQGDDSFGSDPDRCVPTPIVASVSSSPPLAPLATPQLLWNCQIFSPDLNQSFACPGALIDDGSSVVLIRASFADRLGLKRHKLKRPVPLGSAFSGSSSSELCLTDYVTIVPHNTNNSFRSVSTLQAIVAPSLCTEIILGGPFIRANRLLIDLDKNSCIYRVDNCTSIDLTGDQSCIPSHRVSQNKFIPLSTKRRSFNQKCRMFQSKEMGRRLEACYVKAEGVDVTESTNAVGEAIKDRIEVISFVEKLKVLDAEMKKEFADMFPDDIPPVKDLPGDVFHRFELKDPIKFVKNRSYSCPRKYVEFWKTLVDQHLKAGRIRPSDSPYASPAFLIPKADPLALPRWVNDYRELNENTVPDNFPLPRVDTILSDCAKGKIWAKIDMTNAFFQTKVHPDHIKFTAVRTPIGLYEWVVMPMGCRNAPATHQRRMTAALRHLIGSICHVYLDDIIIWSQTQEEHVRNVRTVMEALRKASLFCSLKKTAFFCTDLLFLGHNISQAGLRADPAKVSKIADWPVPKTQGDVRKFLGLVRYVSAFLPRLVDLASVLSPFTSGGADEVITWDDRHQQAFNGIKELVTSHECLTVIDHENPGTKKIFLTTDASDLGTGAVLSFGESWENARPVAFDSKGYSPAERNYPTHDKEMLAIIRALKKFRCELLGSEFQVFTDHRTLEYFTRQKELSKRQLRWQELMADYNFQITYVRGADNTVADALSRTITDSTRVLPIAAVRLLALAVPRRERERRTTGLRHGLSVSLSDDLVNEIKKGYQADSWCRALLGSGGKTQGVRYSNGLLYLNGRLAIPKVTAVREAIFRLAHDSLGHFGVAKTYAALHDSFYWPNMYSTLAKLYVPGCDECQRNKSANTLPPGPLHPLSPPGSRFESVAMDFVGPLPEDEGFNYLLTMTDRLGADIRLIPCRTDLKAADLASLFFDHWFCENGLPSDIVSDRDKLFLSDFWKELTKLLGISLKMSTSFHPQTDGTSERTNRTVIEALRFYVDRQQTGWVKALPKVRFHIMNTVSAASGFSGFQLRLGTSPRLIPPFEKTGTAKPIVDLLGELHASVEAAKDSLVAARALQADRANMSRGEEGTLERGDLAFLSTANRRREFAPPGSNRVAKFMPRFDGPWKVIESWPDTSTYRLDIP
ncbi:hypothetical protein ONZ45_g17089 [Pleurotus djamor]|nr:hypothetical protein ONZ45_g17089 [Pleurotus djamor]